MPSVAQELGGAGTLQGTVKDPTGGVMTAVTVNLSQPVSGLRRTTTTDAMGKFVFRNLPPESVSPRSRRPGLSDAPTRRRRAVGVPIDLDLALALEGATATVEVVGHAEDLLERDPTAHTDIDQSLIAKLPLEVRLRLESGHHPRLARCGRGLQRLLPSDRRPCADAVFDR